MTFDDKISLDDLLKFDLLKIPEPNEVFLLSDIVGVNFKGLASKKGVYVIKDIRINSIIYVGVSRVLGNRLKSHKAGFKHNGHLTYKLKNDGIKEEDLNNEFKFLEVSIFFEESQSKQEIYERYLIYKYNPKYNIDGTEDGRLANKVILNKEEIIKDYEYGLNVPKLAKKYKCSTTRIYSILKQNDIFIRNRNTDRMLNLPTEEVIDDYLSGTSVNDLKNKYNCSHRSIYNILKQYEIKTRGRKLELDENNVIKDYLLNMNTYQLAEKYSCSRRKIKSVLENNNIKMRTLKEANILRSSHK